MIKKLGTDPIKAFILKGFGIVWEQAPLSIANSPLPLTAENCWECGTCCVKISPKDKNILVFGEISRMIQCRSPQNMKIMV